MTRIQPGPPVIRTTVVKRAGHETERCSRVVLIEAAWFYEARDAAHVRYAHYNGGPGRRARAFTGIGYIRFWHL